MTALFVLKLSAGITLMWLLMPRREVTDGFFRIQMRLLLGTAVLTSLLLSAEQTQPWLFRLQLTAACISYPGSIFWALGRRLPGVICIVLLALICNGSLVLHSVLVPNCGGTGLQLLSDMSSAMVIGGTLTAMLLGHWYLTTPTMSIRPLTWFARMLLVAAGLRLLASSISLMQFGFTSSDTTTQLWLAMRLCGGIVVPAAASLMTIRILKYRNTQSATGVLFAALILVFMGEMTAALLERASGVPY